MQPRPHRSDTVRRPTGSTVRGRHHLNHRIIGAPSHPRFFSQLSLIGANLLISNMMLDQQTVDGLPDPPKVKAQVDRQLGCRDRPRPTHRVQLFQKPGTLGHRMTASIAVAPVLLVRELAGECPHLLRTEGVSDLGRSALAPPSRVIEILVEQHKQILALDELANHRAHSVVAALRHHRYCRVRQFSAHARDRRYRPKRHSLCGVRLFATIRLHCLAGRDPRIDCEPVFNVDQYAQDRRKELHSRSTVTLVEQRPPKVITGFVIEFVTGRHVSNVVTPTRRCTHRSPHRGEHVSFELSQVTGVARAAMVGKTKEVAGFRRLVVPSPPANGRNQDSAPNPEVYWVADVSLTKALHRRSRLDLAGGQRSDRSARAVPRRVSAYRVPRYLKRMAGRRFFAQPVRTTVNFAPQPIASGHRTKTASPSHDLVSTKQTEHRRAA